MLELKRPTEALNEYEATLKKEPQPLSRGARRSACRAGLAKNDAAARRYYQDLVKMCAKADSPPRAELAEARARFSLRAEVGSLRPQRARGIDHRGPPRRHTFASAATVTSVGDGRTHATGSTKLTP